MPQNRELEHSIKKLEGIIMKQLTGYELFIEIVYTSFMGEDLLYSGKKYTMTPYLVNKSDFITPSDKTPPFFHDLDSRFKSSAQSELYRKEGRRSWIEKGVSEKRIREVKIGNVIYILPQMNNNLTIGIDGAGIYQDDWVYLICILNDAKAAYIYLEQHLRLPKRKNEFKYRHLKSNYRDEFRKKIFLFLNLFCSDVLFFRTNLLKKNLSKYLKKIYKGKPGKIRKLNQKILLKSILEEFFDGVSDQEKIERIQLRKRLFETMNGARIDIDHGDFPIPEGKVLEILLGVLSADGEFGHPELRYKKGLDSQLSKEIQIADLLAGCTSNDFKLGQTLLPLFKLLDFEQKILTRWFKEEKVVSFYYWGKDS